MGEWFRPVCQALAPEDAAVLSIISVTLALAVLATIALGFGPLRGWFGLTGGPTHDAGDLRDTWRLYRDAGRSHPLNAAFPMPGLSSLAVPDTMRERPEDEQHPRDLVINAALWEGGDDQGRPIGMIEHLDAI